VEIKKYTLSQKSNSIKILEYIEQNNLYKMDLHIKMLINKFNMTEDEVKSALGKLLADHRIIQVNKDVVVFLGK